MVKKLGRGKERVMKSTLRYQRFLCEPTCKESQLSDKLNHVDGSQPYHAYFRNLS